MAARGLDKETFVAQFSKRNPELSRLDKLVACCVEMGEAAENTFQNARETGCWLKRRAIRGPLLLVTSRTHMARARASVAGGARLRNHAFSRRGRDDPLRLRPVGGIS
jgi:DUF218 domain